MIKILVSACLLGSPVRYDGGDKKTDHRVMQKWREEGRLVAVCPEMLGGLGTPRPPAEIVGGRRVVTPAGGDVTAAFQEGARLAAEEAALHGIRVAVLKENSPSCGSAYVYDGTFSHVRVPGEGMTTALLRDRGVAVFSDEQLEEADEFVRFLERAAG